MNKALHFNNNMLMLALPAAFSLIMLVVNANIAFDLAKYAIFYAFVIIPSSIVLSRLLLNDLYLTTFEQAILGYPTAVILYSIIYYVGDLLGARWIVYPVIVLMPILLLRYKSSSNKVEKNSKADSSLLVLYLLAATLFFILFSLMTRLPSTGHPALIYQDSLWTIGNTWAIIRGGFPVTDARFVGVPFSYHMVQNIYTSFSYMITGIDPFSLHIHIAPIYDLFYLVFIVNIGAKIFLAWDIKRAALLTFVLLFTVGTSEYGATGYIGHIYSNPISMFFGLHAYILIFFLLINYSRTNRIYPVYACLVIMLAFSSKAVLVFTIPPSLLIYLLYRIYNGYKIGSQELFFAGGLVIVILILKYSIYDGSSSSLMAQNYSLFTTAQLGRVVRFIGIEMSQFLVPFSGVLKFGYHVFCSLLPIHLSLYSLSFIAVFILFRDFREKNKELYPFFVFVTGYGVVSAVWLSIFSFPGGDVYFIWYSVIALIIPFVSSVSYLVFDKPTIINRVMGAGLIAFGALMFGVYTSKSFNSPWFKGSVTSEIIWDKRASISDQEWVAMQWIKNNISSNEIFISDRRGFKHEGSGVFMGRFFWYSALSGKQFYNEGDAFLGKNDLVGSERWRKVDLLIHSKTTENARKIWKEIPAKYFVLSKRFTAIDNGLLGFSDVVYENPDVAILMRKSN